MALLEVHPSQLQGCLTLPPSKSHTMRALVFGAMGSGITRIFSPLLSPDSEAMVNALRSLGITIEVREEEIVIEGKGGKLFPAENVIDAGNSGQVFRFIAALSTLLPTYTVVTGDFSIRHKRVITPLLEAICQLHGEAFSTRFDGKAPVIVRGPIRAGCATLSGEDSQPISALLMTTSFLQGKSELFVRNPGEKKWIDLTLHWIQKLGGIVSHTNYTHYTIAGSLAYPGFETTIPGDWSGAAFPIAAALLTSSTLTIDNIDITDTQGDKEIIPLLKKWGAECVINEKQKRLMLRGGAVLEGGKIDASEMIDAVPILAVLGCFGKRPLEVMGVAGARKKESDRIRAMAIELKKMGGMIEEREDGFLVTPKPLRGAILESHADHRIAMALTVAAMAAKGSSKIVGAECIAKSYPTFVSDLQRAGGRIG